MSTIPQHMTQPNQNYQCLCWNTAKWDNLPKESNPISGLVFMFADRFQLPNGYVLIIREHEYGDQWVGKYIAYRKVELPDGESQGQFAFIEALGNSFDDLRGGVSYFAGTLE